jgi:hypothetical protein
MTLSNQGLIRLKNSFRKIHAICAISYFFSLHLILHACVQTFDVIGCKVLEEELNKAFVYQNLCNGCTKCVNRVIYRYIILFETWATRNGWARRPFDLSWEPRDRFIDVSKTICEESCSKCVYKFQNWKFTLFFSNVVGGTDCNKLQEPVCTSEENLI